MPKKNFSKIKKDDNLINLKESPFNSKLFFDLNTSLNDIDTSGSDNSNDSNEIDIKNNKNFFLLKFCLLVTKSFPYMKKLSR